MGDLHGVGGPASRIDGTAAWTALRCRCYSSSSTAARIGSSQRERRRHVVFRLGTGHPFVPLLIVPYMSIDLFFFAAPFLCRERDEMRTLRTAWNLRSLRQARTLAFPFRLKFEKPELGGWMGVLFREFCGLDMPYNLVPSLHITLWAILADLYGRYTSGLWWIATQIWFTLIGLSTVLTYQHQIVDVVGGFILAAICFYLVRDPGFAGARARNGGIAAYYGMGAAVLALLAWFIWPWGWLLVWPVAALVMATLGYCGLGLTSITKSTAG